MNFCAALERSVKRNFESCSGLTILEFRERQKEYLFLRTVPRKTLSEREGHSTMWANDQAWDYALLGMHRLLYSQPVGGLDSVTHRSCSLKGLHSTSTGRFSRNTVLSVLFSLLWERTVIS